MPLQVSDTMHSTEMDSYLALTVKRASQVLLLLASSIQSLTHRTVFAVAVWCRSCTQMTCALGSRSSSQQQGFQMGTC